jgi:hypothetical protein
MSVQVPAHRGAVGGGPIQGLPLRIPGSRTCGYLGLA